MNPILVAIPDNRFRGRSHDKLFVKLRFRIYDQFFIIIEFEPIVGDYGTFFGEMLHMLSLLVQKRFRNEYRKVCVYVSGIFEHLIEHVSDVFPYDESVRFDHHTSSDRGILR